MYFLFYLASANGLWTDLPLFISLLTHSYINPFSVYLINSQDDILTPEGIIIIL